MTTTNFVYDELMNFLATASALFGSGAGNNVHLAKAPFTPGVGLTPASFTEADFAGYAVKTSGGLAQQSFVDPVDGQRIVQLLEPAGGWHWETTAAPAPAQVIHGFYVTDATNTTLFGSQLFATPVTLDGINENVDISWIRFKLLNTAII